MTHSVYIDTVRAEGYSYQEAYAATTKFNFLFIKRKPQRQPHEAEEEKNTEMPVPHFN